MIALDEIHRMPLHEKLLIMEAIWSDLTRDEAQGEVPRWHQEILDEREILVAEGMATFLDWEEAKIEINEAVK